MADRSDSTLKAPPAEDRRRGPNAMLRHKILIISGESSMRRSLKRLMTATGAAVEFISDLSKLPAEPPSLLAVDLRSSSAPKLKDLAELFPEKRVICVVGAQDFGQIVACLRDPRCGSVITYDDHFEPEDFIITVTKLLHGQVFGLQKYFPWGVTVYNMEIRSYEEKVSALDVLNAYAELAGARGAVRDRMALVAEELIINGMYHAPADADGQPLYRHMPRKELAKLSFERAVKVACASNGQHFAVAVRDQYGTLDKDTVVKFLSKGSDAKLVPDSRVGRRAGAGDRAQERLQAGVQFVSGDRHRGDRAVRSGPVVEGPSGRALGPYLHRATQTARDADRRRGPIGAAVVGALYRRRAGAGDHLSRRGGRVSQMERAAAAPGPRRGGGRRRRDAPAADSDRLERRQAEGGAQGLQHRHRQRALR
jgi:hypothetical protein